MAENESSMKLQRRMKMKPEVTKEVVALMEKIGKFAVYYVAVLLINLFIVLCTSEAVAGIVFNVFAVLAFAFIIWTAAKNFFKEKGN